MVDGYLVEPEVDEGVAGDVGHGQDVAHEEESGGVPGGGARVTARHFRVNFFYFFRFLRHF